MKSSPTLLAPPEELPKTSGLHSYEDEYTLPHEQPPVVVPSKKNTRDVDTRAQFIEKLHQMIETEDGKIVAWLPDGLSFLIKNPDLFAKRLLPKYCGHTTFTSFERQMNFYRFQRMGPHEKEPSRKRFRRGSAVKYRHKDFRPNSTQEQLRTIKRRTCPTEEKKLLQKKMKDARQLEMDNLLHHKRLVDILQALNSEIQDRQAAQVRRKNQKVEDTTEFSATSSSSAAFTSTQELVAFDFIDLDELDKSNTSVDLLQSSTCIEPVEMVTQHEDALNLITQTTGEIAAAVKHVDLNAAALDLLMDDPFTFDFLTSLGGGTGSTSTPL